MTRLKLVGRVASYTCLLSALHIKGFSWESLVFMLGMVLFELSSTI
jgi:hypothetical protein